MKRTLLALHLPVSRGRADTGEDHTPGYGGTRQKTCVYEWPTETVSLSLSLILTFSLSFSLCGVCVSACLPVCLSLTHTHASLSIHLTMMLLELLMAQSQSILTVCLTHYREAGTDSLSHVRQLRAFLMCWQYLIIKTGALKGSSMKSLKFIGKDTEV